MAGALRKCGYHFEREHTASQEMSAARSFGAGGFPRFHAYTRFVQGEQGPYGHTRDLQINLHLDQKKPSYGRHTAHSGEYEGPLVEQEAGRIKEVLHDNAHRN